MEFALASAYSPITLESNQKAAIQKAYSGDVSTTKGKNVLNALLISADAFSDSTAYATKPFQGSKDIRAYLGEALDKKAAADRAAVVGAMKAGAAREEAVAKFSEDAYFDQWFDEVESHVKELTK